MFKPIPDRPHPLNSARGPPAVLPTLRAHQFFFHHPPPPKGRPSASHPAHPQTSYTHQSGQQWRQNTFGLPVPQKINIPGAAPTHLLRIRSPERVPETSIPRLLIGEQWAGKLSNTACVLVYVCVTLRECPSHRLISSGFAAKISGSCSYSDTQDCKSHAIPPSLKKLSAFPLF